MYRSVLSSLVKVTPGFKRESVLRQIRPNAPVKLAAVVERSPVRGIRTSQCVHASGIKRTPPSFSLVRRVLRKIGYTNFTLSITRAKAYFALESIVDGIDYREFFGEFKMEDTFFSWYLITELHVWMLLVRSISDGEKGLYFSYCVTEAMWEDVTARMGKLTYMTSSQKRTHLQQLYYQFNAALIGYDEGILSNDKVLAGAIWRRIFQEKCSNPEQVERLVFYVRRQVHLLDLMSSESMYDRGTMRWIPFKDCTVG